MKEELVNDNDSDQEDEGGKRQKKKDPELKAERIWKIDGLIEFSNQHETKKRPFFKEELHSALSILDRNDKAKYGSSPNSKELINEHFFFMDSFHIYKIDRKSQEIIVFEDQNIAGLYFSDDNYLYTLSHKRPEKNVGSGFRLYDIWNCITTGEDLNY